MMTFAAMIMTMDNDDDDTNDEMMLLWTDKSQLTVVHTMSQFSNHSAYQCMNDDDNYGYYDDYGDH